jgi:hypothetical protein
VRLQTLELTHRLKELREKESTLLKETDTYRDQLSRICREKEQLELQVQQTAEQRDQAITDRAWLRFNVNVGVVLRELLVFVLGVVSCYVLYHHGTFLQHMLGRSKDVD